MKYLIIPVLIALILLSLISGYDLRAFQNLPWEAALILAPSGYLSLALSQLTGLTSSYQGIFWQNALPRVSQSVEFPASLSYFAVFIQSNAIECVFFLLFYMVCSRSNISASKAILTTTLSNAVTHPVVFFGFMASGLPYFWAVLLAEIFAIFLETLLHRRMLGQQLETITLVVFCGVANLASWQLGPMLTKTWLALVL